ncbi:MAG TPA: ADP-glyceromanno-heptose 6-epimerase [Xanthobacteraceae bacterium]|nr:ADP-glyceromanno-heptose 6-epimerase [Xanthobacteraceae bacterium]
MLLVTGGAGFIGSNVVAALNDAGRTDVVVNDSLGADERWRNLQKRQIADLVPIGATMRWLEGRKLDAIIHLGANSDTTARDGDAVMVNNFGLSLALLDWCTRTRTRFIYASSAATYGDGSAGFEDDGSVAALRRLVPLNLYAWSKHQFDLVVAARAARGDPLPPQWVGLKFFNVFGPNEYHKGHMMSLVAKSFDRVHRGEAMQLFRSHRPDIPDGGERRDFVYVDDAVAVIRWLLENSSVSGLFNVGTGCARTFGDLARALFSALGREPKIEYIDMPEAIRGRYQYFTEASIAKLRRAGYNAGFTTLEEGVRNYVTRFLATSDRYR